jgi:hypothetical protein
MVILPGNKLKFADCFSMTRLLVGTSCLYLSYSLPSTHQNNKFRQLKISVCERIMDHLLWQSCLEKLSVTATHDSHMTGTTVLALALSVVKANTIVTVTGIITQKLPV